MQWLSLENVSKWINFSTPYLVSYSRFLTNQHYANKPFNLELLKGKRIGVNQESVFNQQIREMGIKNLNVVEFVGIHSTEEMLEALSNDQVDFVLMDDPSALYWVANSSGDIVVIGKPILYGYGLGIAVNKENSLLLQLINSALFDYQYLIPAYAVY